MQCRLLSRGGFIIKAFYDESRQLLFATNLNLNEVDVLSGKDLSVQACVPIAEPFGIDQMPDGNTLVVGTGTQAFYRINEDTFAVTQYLAPNLSQQQSTLVLLVPVAMANGKVLFIGKDPGAASGDIFVYAGQSIVEWDSTSGIFSTPIYFRYTATSINNLRRSADRNWAAFAADKLYVYSSATDAFSSSTLMSSLPNRVDDVAVNPNGSQFAVITPIAVYFYDSAFNALGSVSAASGFTFQYWSSQYSLDGSRFFWKVTAAGSVLDIIDNQLYRHWYRDSILWDSSLIDPIFLGMDSKQRAFFAAGGGVGLLGCSSPRTSNLSLLEPLAQAPTPFR